MMNMGYNSTGMSVGTEFRRPGVRRGIAAAMVTPCDKEWTGVSEHATMAVNQVMRRWKRRKAKPSRGVSGK
jgi:hypothetical protein